MAKSIFVKRKPGRPATGSDRLVAARMPNDLIDALDKWACANGVERSEAIRTLLWRALKTKAK
ncbi:hypothetical protein ACVIHH_003659 [Bradyrhizobium sp. USDA 4518]